MKYIRFKHKVDGEVIEITMQPDTSMKFSSDKETCYRHEELDVEDGVLRLIVTTDIVGREGPITTCTEMHCSLDQLTADSGLPAWQHIRKGEQYGL